MPKPPTEPPKETLQDAARRLGQAKRARQLADRIQAELPEHTAIAVLLFQTDGAPRASLAHTAKDRLQTVRAVEEWLTQARAIL